MTKTLVTAAIALVVLVSGVQLLAQKGAIDSRDRVTTATSPVEANLALLRQPGSRDVRVTAARYIGSNASAVTPDLVHKLSQPLLQDNDALIRKEVADVMRQLAVNNSEPTLRPANYEPQMLEILLTAFNRESDAAVRINIVQAAGQLNHPDALLILDKAAEDSNPTVREAAHTARAERERRLLTARSG